MPRTRLGITAPLLAAGCFFVTFLGGFTPAILLAGYVLLMEQDAFLKRSAVKAVVLYLSYSLLLALIGFIPDLMNWIGGWASLADNYPDFGKFSQVMSCITRTLDLIYKAFFIVLGINAFKGKEIKVPFVDTLLAKYL